MANTPKTIKPMQVALIPAPEIKPGHIIAEGVIVNTEWDRRTEGDILWMETLTASVHADRTESVQVYAMIDEDMVQALREVHGYDS